MHNVRGSTSRNFVDLTERAIYLRSIPVAAELPPTVLHAVAACCTEREFAAGELLMHAGKPVKALELLTEGSLKLERGGRTVGKLLPPQSIGFLNIVARTDGSYDAIAEAPVRALELPAERLYDLLEDHFSLLEATLHYLADRLLYEMQDLPEEALSMAPVTIPIAIPDRPLNLVEKVFFLRCMSAYKRANVNSLTVIAEQMAEIRKPAGAELWRAGDEAPWSLFLVAGTVRNETPDGRTFRYGPGTAVGGTETLARKGRWYSTWAETDVVGLRGSPDQLLDLLEDNFDIASDLISAIAGGLAALLARKAEGGAGFAQARAVSKLGAVPVGA